MLGAGKKKGGGEGDKREFFVVVVVESGREQRSDRAGEREREREKPHLFLFLFLFLFFQNNNNNNKQGQLRYMLGDGARGWSRGRSFLVGHGKAFPQQPHQRAASCPPPPATCNYLQLHSKDPNPNVLVGALVGGPFFNDSFPDDRMDYAKSEVVRREEKRESFLFSGFDDKEEKKSHARVEKKLKIKNRESSTTQGSPRRSPERPSSPGTTPGAAACRREALPTGRSPR